VTDHSFEIDMVQELEIELNYYLARDVEALAFFVACLCQNVDHRGVNSHFNLCVTDPYHIYKQEEGLMEVSLVTLCQPEAGTISCIFFTLSPLC
jgi:hypothetical protein